MGNSLRLASRDAWWGWTVAGWFAGAAGFFQPVSMILRDYGYRFLPEDIIGIFL